MKKMLLLFLFLSFYKLQSQALQVFTTIESRNALRNYSTISDKRFIAATGLLTSLDQPTEIWTYDATSMAVDDGVRVLKPNDIPIGSPGRYIWVSYFVKQTGPVKYSKEHLDTVTTSSNSVTFDISAAGFTTVGNVQCSAFLNGATVLNAPIAIVTAKSTTSITVSLFESKTTNTLLISSAEGLEPHAVAGTEVYITVRGN